MSKKLTTEEFIEKAKKIHGDKYDYSKIDYKNTKTKITIICPIHGEFHQLPSNHLHGGGCPKCANNQKKTLKEFLEDARKVHGDKYDYSKVNYVNGETKVCIICPEHGEFYQTPDTHLKGCGCRKCFIESMRMTTSEFICRAKEKHGDKYDYSKVDYKASDIKVTIICPEHGEFTQLPSDHLHGTGCPGCSGNKKRTADEFVQNSRKIHGDKYEYDKVDYVSNRVKVCITCPKHGEFWQRPVNHIRGAGCPKCAIEKETSNTEDFIAKAKKVHGDKYDYSKVDYKGSDIKVCIICSKHGEFWQKPNGHLGGNGCPECSKRRLLSNTEDFITKAKKVHGDKYNYTKVDYKGSNINVCIICPEHGEFWQQPSNHLVGNGCPKCSSRSIGTEEFIRRAKKVHGDKYDYSKVIYKNSSIKVCIVCPVHGEYFKSPSKHLAGWGCNECSKEARWKDYKKGSNPRYWTKDRCCEEAKKYRNREQFNKGCGAAYRSALNNGWLEEYDWLKPTIPEGNIDNIYLYLFEEQNSVYIGRTVNLESRDRKHRYDNESSVYKFSIDNNVPIPQITVIESELSLLDGAKREGDWVDFYRSQGFFIINRAPTGSLGSFKQIWTKDLCYDEAKKYSSKTQFRTHRPSCYDVAKKNDWLKDYTWFEKVNNKKKD